MNGSMVTEKSSLIVVSSNVRNSEIMDWIKRSNCDVSAINGTDLTGEEYLDVNNGCTRHAANIEWTKGRYGGGGITIKEGIRCEEITGKMEDVCFVRIGKRDNKVDWLLGSVYMNCERVQK